MIRKVFLSCVTKEFLPHRDKLAHDLQMPNVKVEWQEAFVETGHTTLDKLDGYIQGCNEVIHIVGFAAGSPALAPEVAGLLKKYPDLTERVPCLKEALAREPAPITYTQWEAWLAIYHGIPCYVYRAEPSAPRAPGFVEDGGQKRLQEEHWQRLESAGKDRGTFQDEQHLCRLVLRGLYLPPELGAAQAFDHEAQIQKLPLPLAQLCRRALNAKTPMDRHRTAYDLWEAGLKLLGAVAVVAYAERVVAERLVPNAQLAGCLQNLARPTLEHWWELVRRLVPVLADAGDAGFGAVRDLLLGRRRDDLPRAARLDAALSAALDGQGSSRDSVCLTELFDRLIRYRILELGRVAAERRSDDFHDRMGQALLAGVGEVLGRLDVLAGHRLLYLEEVRRQPNGEWLIERSELVGENGRRIESSIVPDSGQLPRAKCVCLAVVGPPAPLRSLHPLVIYDAEAVEVMFLNARRGRQGTEYLGYTTGRTLDRPDLGDEQRELVGRLLGMAVSAEQAASWAAKSQAGEPSGEVPSVEPSRSIGEFELLGRLGQGGMGVVYRVWQPSLGRQVALKCMLRVGDPKGAARFSREIRALGRVDHPNVVKVFTSGSQGDQWFYAMELIEGAELSRVCDQLAKSSAAEIDEGCWSRAVTTACTQARSQETQLSASHVQPVRPSIAARSSPGSFAAPLGGSGHVKQVVEIIRQIAEAAHALHEVGVVHRDIKPGNIMLTAAGAHPVLMDLGLAQLADETEGRLTRTRQFVGTLRYASPEQVLAAAQVDRRTDVYSLGATLWELLTLQPIFGATDATPTPELMLKIQTIDPESPRTANRNVPSDLEAIVLKCLEKDRARRYATAGELADDLKRWLAGEPVLAHRQTFGYRLRKRLAKHPRKLLAAGIVALLMTAIWFALADYGLPVPGSQIVQRWLDRHEASVFRPVPSEARLHAAAAEQRQALRQELLNMVGPNDGWFAPAKDLPDAWTQMQVTTALFFAPEADRAQLQACVTVLVERLFEPNGHCDPFFPDFGWTRPVDGDYSAEAISWALSAIAKVLSAPGFASPGERTRLLQRLDQVQAALDKYRSIDKQSGGHNGGWNLFAKQKDASQTNIYITLTVCQGLLDLRQADLPWRQSRELRDSLLRESIAMLLRKFDGRGWSTPGAAGDQFNDGITSQIFATLLAAEHAGLVELPAAVLEQIPRHLADDGTRSLQHTSTVSVFIVSIHKQHGKEARTAQRTMRSLGYPWAVNCAISWLRRCERTGAPHDEIVRSRRVLSHLLLTQGPAAVQEVREGGFAFAIAETLIGLSSLDPP